MLDGMSDSIQRSSMENLHSREVDRQSPTGLIFIIINAGEERSKWKSREFVGLKVVSTHDICLTAIFQDSLGRLVPECVSVLDVTGAKYDAGGGANWSWMCWPPVKSSTNKPTPSFFTGWTPFLSPNQHMSEQSN